ncbi:MAG: hypothetical protein QXD55_00845 [Candidatus Aenigmatarchaeota archaeon]
MLKMLFLFTLAITIALTTLQLYGLQLIESIIIMIIINFISLGASIEMEKRKSDDESKSLISSKLESIEKICNDIFTHVTSPNPGLEAKLEKQKNDVSYILDKIAKKSLELEERLNAFGQALASTIKAENKEETEKETNKDQVESFNIGEIVYVEDNNNK